MQNTTTLTQKGQITIPQIYRHELNLSTGDKMSFALSNDGSYLLLRPTASFSQFRGSIVSKRRYSKERARKSYLPQVVDNTL